MADSTSLLRTTTVWSNGVKALQAFGLDPMKYAGQMDRMAYLKHDTGEVLCDFALDELYDKVSLGDG